MGAKCKIIINPYLRPQQSVLQAQRIRQELIKLCVDTEIVTDAFLRFAISDGDAFCSGFEDSVIIYLDKDKYLSEILQKKGYRLFNSHNAIRICDDKARTYINLANANINMPKTIFAPLCYVKDDLLPVDYLQKVADQLKFPLIVKESYGSMGKGVHIANDLQELISLEQKLKTTSHFYQQFISSSSGKDVRVIVIGGVVVCAMLRSNEQDFRSNVYQGGKGQKIELDDPLYYDFLQMAQKCADILQLDYCGVDLLIDDNYKPILCEVNSNAFFEESERVCGVNVAKAYAEHIVKNLK